MVSLQSPLLDSRLRYVRYNDETYDKKSLGLNAKKKMSRAERNESQLR